MSGLGNKGIMAKNLKYYLEQNHKSRNDICYDLGIRYSTFSEWISGNAYPRIDKIEQMANYFGIQKSDLIEDRTAANEDDTVAHTKDEKKILLLARHLEKIPEEKRERIIKNFEDTIDTYLDAMGIQKED